MEDNKNSKLYQYWQRNMNHSQNAVIIKIGINRNLDFMNGQLNLPPGLDFFKLAVLSFLLTNQCIIHSTTTNLFEMNLFQPWAFYVRLIWDITLKILREIFV